MIRLFGFAPKTRSQFANYPGVGQVFGVVATYRLSPNSSVVYVPVVSYGCDTSKNECQTVGEPFSRTIAAISVIIGFCFVVLGHRYFKLEMFLMGFLAFLIIFYMIVGRESKLSLEWVTLIATACGVIGGIIWLLVWYYKSEPALSIILPVMLLGFLSACCVYYVPINFEYLVSDFNFWSSFVCCMLVLPVFLITITWQANIIACSIIGSYLLVAPTGHYLGSSIAYIVLNILRRATVPYYKFVVMDPPFQFYDEIIFGAWAGIALLSLVFHFAREWNKPPFPGTPPLPQLPWFKQRQNVARYRRHFPMPTSRLGYYDERTPLIRSLDRPIPRDLSFVGSI